MLLSASKIQKCIQIFSSYQKFQFSTFPRIQLLRVVLLEGPHKHNLHFFKHLQALSESIKRVLANNPERRAKQACLP